MTWFSTKSGNVDHARLLAQMEQLDGRHLAIVRYRPDHNPTAEWVYNDADIDKAKVVWAREMDSVSNRTLIQYFRDHRVWLVEADLKPPRLSPYSVPRVP